MNLLWLLSNAQAGSEGTFWLPPQASTLAADIDTTFYFIYWVSVVFFIILMGAMIYLAVVYKKKSDSDKTVDLKGSHTLEFAWSVFPSFLLIAMFVMGFQTYMRSTIPPADALEVRVEGYQWAWVYNYPSLGVSVGAQESLVVPKGQSVRLTMSSRDVLHSFYVPDFRIKKDVLPNRYTMQWFQADELIVDETVHQKISGQKREDGSELVTIESNIAAVKQTIVDRATEEGQALSADQIQVGVHQVFCTEYCGNDHSRMLSSVIVLEQEHFDLWVRGTTRFDPYKKFAGQAAEIGKHLANKNGCTGCHNITGDAGGSGPTWKGLVGKERQFTNADSIVADANYIRESILNPSAKIVKGDNGGAYGNMNAGWDKLLSAQDIDMIISYIETLK
ncbi:MAG: c-type cytochrome [Myxococcota bacterium]|nr:c-type cytochrome [Myxococcota bacterium]